MAEYRCPTTTQVQAMIDASGGGQAYPIGSVFLSVVSTNPNTLLGYGTWSQIATGQFLVGQSGSDADFDVGEETGGAKTHTHDTHNTVANIKLGGAEVCFASAGDAAHSESSNLPPYFVVYAWKRTA